MKLASATLVALLASVSVAHAEDADPDTAQRLSIVGSAFPLAVVGIGVLVGVEGSKAPIRDVGAAIAVGGALAGIVTPALGDFYAHRYLDPAIAMRAAGVLVEAVGIIHGFSNEVGDCADSGPCHHSATTVGLIATGAALYLGGMLLDITGAPDAARTWNARHDVQLVPTALQLRSSLAPGLAIALKF